MRNILEKYKWIILGIIIVVAIIFRFWQLGAVPASPDWDEVALGYNAYSILHTGKDEYGAFLPVVMRSFDDYKPALYSYITIPSIALFGLNVWAVRLPSAVFGVLTVLAVYFLAKELFKKESIALLSSFLLAISPWHIQFSRIAFESNVGLSFNVFGALFFIKGLKRPWLLFLSIASFVASAYVYQSEKVFSPLIILSLVVIYRKELFKLPKKFLVSVVIVGLMLSLPMLFYIVTNKNALERAQGVSVFADQSSLKQDAARLLVDHKNHDYLGLVLDNRRFVFVKEVIANYMSHFDFNWLFITGDLIRHHAPNMGLLYIWELPFILAGIYFLLFGEYDKKTKWTIFSWYLLAPVAASVTTGVPHAVRALNFLPTYQILSAIGIITLFSVIKNKKLLFRIGLVAVFLCALLNISYYADQYFAQTNYYTAIDWQYGYQDAVPTVKEILSKYKKVIVSNQPFMDQSYMFFLFYLQYSPNQYQQESILSSGGFRENHQFGKFDFRPINWNQEIKSSDTLYVGRASDFPSNAKIIKTVTFPNGKPAMLLVEG
ncbi:MAG TPA: glycosyltransferase family 39 protein [Patescibacteria group bacterium]